MSLSQSGPLDTALRLKLDFRGRKGENDAMPGDAPAPYPFRRHAVWASAAILLGSAVLLFARLGHYEFWDDEAITALTARSVARTGDTSVRVDDHNLLIYRDGLLVKNFKDRFTPPLQFYVLAPILRLFGDGTFACRLPFAACGLLTVAIGVRWLWRSRPPPAVWWAAALLLLTNAEFFLFFRQCRYYGLAMGFTAAAAYLYYWRDGRTRGVAALSAVLAGLLAAQYLNYAAAAVALAVDYAVWGRRRPITAKQWAVLLVPQLIVGGVVCSIWNPVARAGTDAFASTTWLSDRLHLLAMNAGGLVTCDFVVLPLLLIAPLLYLKRRATALLRVPAAVATYLVGIALFVATVVARAGNAEVRYLAPLLPLCVLAAVVAVWGTLALPPRLRYALWLVAALTTLFPTARPGQPFGVPTALAWYHELLVPQAEPYTPTIAWVNAHVPPGSSVLVRPDYMTYPLMLRAPAPTYAWQLDDRAPPAFAALPPIHFAGRVPPDYVIAFGRSDPRGKAALDAIAALAERGVAYEEVATLPYYWQDFYRPERLWREFATHPPVKDGEIYIYRRRSDPRPATVPLFLK